MTHDKVNVYVLDWRGTLDCLPIEHAVKCIERLRDQGHKIVINSSWHGIPSEIQSLAHQVFRKKSLDAILHYMVEGYSPNGYERHHYYTPPLSLPLADLGKVIVIDGDEWGFVASWVSTVKSRRPDVMIETYTDIEVHPDFIETSHNPT